MSDSAPLAEEKPVRSDGHWNIGRKWLILAAIIAALTYVAGVFAYAQADDSHREEGKPTQVTNGLRVVAAPIKVEPQTDEMTMRIEIEPLGNYATGSGMLAKTVVLAFNSVSQQEPRILKAGQLIPVMDMRFEASGSWQRYPFDGYISAFYLAAFTDESERVPLQIEGAMSLQGWGLTVDYQPKMEELQGSVIYALKRPVATKAFVVIELVLFILIAISAMWVALAVNSRKRRIEPALLGWGAALLFALPTLRNNLPGAPPVGAWMDILVFLWVIVFVIIAYLLVILTWIRKSARPVDDKAPANQRQ